MRSQFLAATALSGLMLIAGGAAAQTASPDPTNANQVKTPNDPTVEQVGTRPGQKANQNQDDAAAPDGSVVVTGSRLARPNIDSVAPITSITADELFSTGNVVLGDALNDLPQLRSTYSQSNSTRFIGTTGLNELDLRGLGPSRTLVLVNGRRHVTSVPGSSIVDTNSIPNDLVDRIDIVTGGQSAIYGSDAIAGVVNFVLKDNFDGLHLNAQGGVSTHGDRGQEYVSAVFGKNFSEGRGNISGAAEYSHSNALYYRDRDFETGAYSGRHQFQIVDNTAADPVGGTNGVIDRQFFEGVRNGNISTGGILNAVCNTTALLANAARCRQNSTYVSYYGSASTTYVGQRYAFDNAGNLVFSNPSVDFRDSTAGSSTNTIGGLGSTLYETGQLIPRQDRVSINVLAHYDFSDALTGYFEGKFVHIENNQEGQPSFFQNGTIAYQPYGVRTATTLPLTTCNNGFLTAANISTLQSIGYCAAGATSTAVIPLNRFNIDFGGRGELSNRDLFRFVAGVRGTFNDDWKYDVGVTYGEFNSRLTSLNNLVIQRFANAAQAVLAPANYAGSNYLLNASGAKVVCGINADANTANDDAACIPLNLFGYGQPNQAALNYVNTTAQRRQFANQLDVNGYVSGDSSQLFSLPGGPVGFVIGGEYRREQSSAYYYDPLTQGGFTFLNAIQPFFPPVLEVKEGFGELNIPLLKNVRFARELTVTGAARVSNYNNSAGTVFAWDAGAVYAPADFIRFRGNYSKSVRVPTQGDLYTPFSQNYASLADPCDIANINANPNRARNCAAAGVPTNFINTPARTATLGYFSGGNPNLTAETSRSFTFGGVIEPRGIAPGLSITVDYYNITVRNLIATLAAQTILTSCYDNPNGINNQYCALVTRNADFTFANPAVVSAGINFAKQKTSGIDLNLAYNHKMDNGDQMGLSVLATWVGQRDNYINPADANYATRQLSNLGDPQWETQATFAYTHKAISLRYQFQYIGPMIVSGAAYENFFAFDGRAATDPDAFPFAYYPGVSYHNFRIGVNVNKQFQFYTGVDNAFDTLPPYGLFGNGAGDAIYDSIGRYVYAGIKANF